MFYLARIALFSFCLTSVLAQTYVGTLFNFVPGLGACGYTNSSDEIVASVSSTFFSTFPGATTNPNKNPICHRSILIKSGLKNLTAPIVDFYVANSEYNVGLSAAGFSTFADVSDGIVPNVTWSVV